MRRRNRKQSTVAVAVAIVAGVAVADVIVAGVAVVAAAGDVVEVVVVVIK